MPQQNMSSKLGGSTSKMCDRVIQNSKNVQQPVAPASATAAGTAYNKKPVKC